MELLENAAIDEYRLLDESLLCKEQLFEFLKTVDRTFPVALTDKVDLSEYADKLLHFGTLCATVDECGMILSLCAGYTRNTWNHYAYISAVAVRPGFVGKGLASYVVKAFEKRVEDVGLLGIHLYASYENVRAMNMWTRLRYEITEFSIEERQHDAHFLKLMKRTVLVTALGSLSCSATIRSLRKAGYRIIGCDINNREWIANSVFVDNYYQVPLVSDADDYLRVIGDIVKREKVGYILPSTDVEVDALCNYGEIEGALVCLSTKESVLCARDKMKTYTRIKDVIGTAAIPTYYAFDFNPEEAQYPLICKPLHGRSSQGLIKILSKAELEELHKHVDFSQYCVQPFVEGRVVTVDVIRQVEGGLKHVVVSRREFLRTYNGAGIAVEIFETPECLRDCCIRIADELDILGCVNFEFIEDPDGSYHFLECNPRFSGGLGFSLEAGYDFIQNHLRCFQGIKIDDEVVLMPGYISRRYEEYRITKTGI